MRFARNRSRSGCTVRSSVATMYQLGFVSQATPGAFRLNKSAAGGTGSPARLPSPLARDRRRALHALGTQPEPPIGGLDESEDVSGRELLQPALRGLIFIRCECGVGPAAVWQCMGRPGEPAAERWPPGRLICVVSSRRHYGCQLGDRQPPPGPVTLLVAVHRTRRTAANLDRQPGEHDAPSNCVLPVPGVVPTRQPPVPASRRPAVHREPGPPRACATPRPSRTRAAGPHAPRPHRAQPHLTSGVAGPGTVLVGAIRHHRGKSARAEPPAQYARPDNRRVTARRVRYTASSSVSAPPLTRSRARRSCGLSRRSGPSHPASRRTATRPPPPRTSPAARWLKSICSCSVA